MTVTQSQIEQALIRLDTAIDSPRALTIRPEDQASLHQAIDRVHAQLLGEADAVLTIALAGCTGAGKSTLINALAGSPIAESSDRRPCTMQPRVYHHRDVPAGGLPDDLASQATFVSHDRPELLHKVIIDTPDLDTFHTQNRAATRAMLKAAGLVIYVFSPERYVEERAWSVIREEQRFSACLAVINKADTAAPAVLQRIADEIRQRFAEMGKPDIRLLCICAAAHVPDVQGRLHAVADRQLDEFITLRAYIEHELQAGDLAKMIRQQRRAVLEDLEAQVGRVVPPAAQDNLDALEDAARDLTQKTTQELAEQMHEPLLAVEADLWPLIVIRKHQRFWGPFRTWLAVTDFLRYGLPRMVRQMRAFQAEGSSFASRTLADQADRVGDAIRTEARQLQDVCFESGLPVQRWLAITADVDGRRTLAAITQRIEARFESLAARAFRQNTAFIWMASFLAWVLPAGLVVLALLNLLQHRVVGPLAGMFAEDHAVSRLLASKPVTGSELWDLLALVVLSYLLLHMVTNAALAGRGLFARSSIARQSLDEVLGKIAMDWVAAYRGDVLADVADLREPLAVLRAAVDGMIVRPNRFAAAETGEDHFARAGNQADPAAETVEDEAHAPAVTGENREPAKEQSQPTATHEPHLSPAELLRRSMQRPGK